jgi:hypothetical protein
VPNGIQYSHIVLPEQPKLSVELRIGSGQHPSFAGCNHFARMEGKAGDVSVRLTDPFPLPIDPDLAAGSTSSVFNGHERTEIAGHAIWCTTTMARVRGGIASAASAGSTLYVARSMSTKTGIAPQYLMQLAAAMKE